MPEGRGMGQSGAHSLRATVFLKYEFLVAEGISLESKTCAREAG